MTSARRVLHWASALMVIGTSLPGLHGALASGPSADEAAVRTLYADMIEIYNRGDARGIGAMFTVDGEMITGGGDHLIGPADIEKYLANLMIKLPKGTRFMSRVTDVRFVGPDVAIVSSDGGFVHPGETAVSEKNHGLQSMVAQRQNGRWRAVLFQRTRIVPTPPAPAR